MSSTVWLAPTANYVQTTLNGAITDSATTITLNSTTNLSAPGYVVIDRTDSSGTATPSAREVVSYTGISGNDITGCTRGADGSTNRSHSNGAIVETMPTIGMWNSLATIVGSGFDGNGYLKAINSPVSISRAHLTNIINSALTVTTSINASGASVVGFGGTGGFNALFQVPGGLASQVDVGGQIAVPAAFTASFMHGYVKTPSSIASISIAFLKNGAVFGVLGIAGGATFGSSASLSATALAVGDYLSVNINSNASLGTDLTALLRAT